MALFDEPPRVTINNPDAAGGSRKGLLLGLTETSNDYAEGMICIENGEIVVLNRSWFTIDWRYSAETDRWADVDAQEPDQMG